MSVIDKKLNESAYKLAVEIHAGKWDHAGADTKPASACDDIINELKSRCPGASTEKYKKILAEALYAAM